jgi:hypothetical protein
LGEKIDKEVNQDGPDKGCEEEGTFEGSEKGQDSIINYHLGWINDDSKDANKDAKLLKMLILN